MTELLSLITGLDERFAHVGKAVEDGGVVKRFLAIENLLSDQRRASGFGSRSGMIPALGARQAPGHVRHFAHGGA